VKEMMIDPKYIEFILVCGFIIALSVAGMVFAFIGGYWCGKYKEGKATKS
jgi:hypothetical protein